VILATQEAEIRRIIAAKPASTNSSRDPILKKPITKTGLVEWLKMKTPSSSPSTEGGEKKTSLINNLDNSQKHYAD
jgi:hypothetical protein